MGQGLGYLGVLVAVTFFGSNFLPVKQYDTGDGIFFQFMLCTGIWITGLFCNLIQGCPEFHAAACIGGMLWATGNLSSVPIIQRIGLGKGLIIWGSTNLLMGWCSGFFGIIIKSERDSINSIPLNILGVLFAIASLLISIKIESNGQSKENDSDIDDKLLVQQSTNYQLSNEKESKTSRQYQGIIMACIAGCFYGINFTPPTYVQQNYPNASQNALDYVFAHFCGIFFMSTLVFVGNACFRKATVYPEVIFPGFCSGVMWGIAQIGFFYANQVLGQTIAFPLVVTVPGIIGALWGIFLFKEIQGKKNYLLLFLTSLTAAICAICIVLSKN